MRKEIKVRLKRVLIKEFKKKMIVKIVEKRKNMIE